LFTNKGFVLLALSGGFMSGSYGGWQSVLEPILLPLGFTDTEVAWIGFYAITAGSAGALILGKLADMFFIKKFKVLLIVGYVLSIASFVFFSASTTKDLSFIPHNYWVVVVTSTLGGMTLNAILPLFYEFSVELTYPAPGGTILLSLIVVN
jgi:MFS family permease